MAGPVTRAAALLATAALTMTAAGCGGDEADPRTANAADVSFATDMAQHHAQSVQLVNLAVTRTLPPSTWAWTEGARTQRIAELRSLTRQLEDWGEPVPETGMQHSDEGKHVAFDTEIPGVADEEQVHALDQLRGSRLARAWLRLMITHEQGAVELAQGEVEHGQYADAVAYARKDLERHRRLVARLQRLVAHPA